MVKTEMKDVCRLCLMTDDLVWIFDKRLESNDMKDVIYITTGVEITINDIISQKICKKCCQITIKMFEFRRTSLKNDSLLREQLKTFLKDKEIKIPNTQVTIRSERRKEPNITASGKIKAEIEKDHVKVKKETKPQYKIHPSVRNLFKIHPQIKLPNMCLKYNITPCVSMPMDAVENYFKSHNLDFQKSTRLALRAGRVATKRTSSVAKPKNAAPSKAVIPSKIHKGERNDKVPRIEVNEEVVNTLKIKLPLPSSFCDKVFRPEVQFNSNNSDNSNQNLEQASHKRKADVDIEDKKEMKKATFIESLGLTSKVPDQSGATLPYVTNKSAPLHICEICNSVQYSAKDLRKHQNRHLRCQFCKMKFRSLESKKEHLDNKCPIKNMMNNLPDVKLRKIEFDLPVRRTYPNAFNDYPPLNGLVETSSITTSCEESVSAVQPVDSKDISANVVSEVTHNHQKETVELETSEVIEILSDEEEPTTVPSGSNKEPPPINSPLVPPVHATQTIPIPQIDNIVYNTVSIVRPEIKIKGSSALDMIDARLTDIKVLKELLTHYRPVHLYVEKNTQTEMPTNESIFVNRPEMSAELKQLKPQLHVYKIPITMKPGIFNVTFSYNAEPKPPKKLCLWNDLNIIDIKTPVAKSGLKSASHDDSILQNKYILPSTATSNSTGVATSKFIRVNASSLCPITTTPYTSSNMININSLRNSTLQSTIASSAKATVSPAPAEQTSNAESSAINAGQHFGTIRVKNVWELT